MLAPTSPYQVTGSLPVYGNQNAVPVPASTRVWNPLRGPIGNLVGANVPGVPGFAKTVSSGIASMAKAAAVKMGLMAPAASTMGVITPAMHAGLAVPALGPFTGLSAALPGLGVGMLVLQAAMAPKITPKQRAEKANWDYQNFLNMRPDVRDIRRESRATGQFVDPKRKFLGQIMKNALFAENQGAGHLLHKKLLSGIGGIQFSTGLGLGDPREGLFVPRVVRQEGQGPKQFLTGANIRERLDLPAVQGLAAIRVDPRGDPGKGDG